MIKRTVLLIYTGGTIGMVKDKDTGTLVPFDFDDLLLRMPELSHLDCDIETFTLKEPIDSSNIQPTDWIELGEKLEEVYDDYDGFVILHGTDTMSYTASALSFIIENLKKPVIFTGSQLPISDFRTDAKENLITAIQIATDYDNKGKAIIQEVGLYFENKLYRGNRTTKINSEHFEAFASLNFPALAESGVHLTYNDHLFPETTDKSFKVHKKLNQNVAIIRLFPGLTESILDAIINIDGLKGLILETYGSGNAPNKEWFVNSIGRAVKNGIIVVNVTQCPAGMVDHNLYEVGLQMRKLGVVGGRDMTTEAAITKLMFVLGNETYNKSPEKWLRINLRGEMKDRKEKF
ncbi:MAG: L-asparaginase 1 [Desulfobacteraceae bacterium 4572_19]|nr:MAG: L-asparaginase 1 [Desulfobacteraceae bacterium 4572_19]